MSSYWRLPGTVRLLVMMAPALVLAWVVDESTTTHPLWPGSVGLLLCVAAWAVLEHRHGRPTR